jgi:F-type H+-transporting ATPase subunit delta
MPSALAFRYARALADVVTKADSGIDPRAVAEEVAGFERLIEESADLRIALESPAIPPPKKRAVVARLAAELPVSDVVRRFLFVLIDHRRVPLLHDAAEAFEAVMDERLGIARADVASARPLSSEQQQQISTGLSSLTGKQVRARFRIESGLIGGVTARVGSTVYDGSVRGHLDALKQRLAGVGT